MERQAEIRSVRSLGPIRREALRALLLLPLLLLPSCSKLSTGVYWAETFAFSRLDDYFLLSSSQTSQAKQEFGKAFKEVRRTEFPQLADVLDAVALEVEARQLDPARIEHWSQRLASVLKASAARFEPLGQQLVSWQTASSFQRFDKEAQARHEKSLRQLSSPEERMKTARKRLRYVVGETLGSLSREQESLLLPLLSEAPLQLQNESRLSMLQQFQLQRGDPTTRESFVRRYFTDWESVNKPDYIAAHQAYRKKSAAIMHEILKIATAKQKEHLIANFRSRASELRKLSQVSP